MEQDILVMNSTDLGSTQLEGDAEDLLDDEHLIDEISIDGMCGVY